MNYRQLYRQGDRQTDGQLWDGVSEHKMCCNDFLDRQTERRRKTDTERSGHKDGHVDRQTDRWIRWTNTFAVLINSSKTRPAVLK